MAKPTRPRAIGKPQALRFDVIIVGAGISGIGTAYHLSTQCPDKSFTVLEALSDFGGTWFTNRYPGARSDSDLYTYGYRFKPWSGPPMATREEILTYMQEVIEENDLGRHIRYRHTVVRASWSSETKLWSLDVERTNRSQALRFEARVLAMCQGYYWHRRGYTPDWPGFADYRGRIIHAQEWPDDAGTAGKSVIVIGSGATAATMIPALARDSGPITMLQRSPTFYNIAENVSEIADTLRKLQIDESWVHEIARRKSFLDEATFIGRTFSEPDKVKDEMIGAVRAILGPDYDVETHFTPRYRPWQQRIAYTPGGDLFKAIRDGKVNVVTDEIERFTADSIRLKSGRELSADIIIAATGFDLCVMGGIPFSSDGRPIDFAETVTYRGMMFSGVPNLTWTFGYLRASWTMRVDMNADFLCRLIKHMDAKGAGMAMPALRSEEEALPRLPWVSPKNFNGGYILRSLHLMPKRLDTPEWQHAHDYWTEKDRIPAIDLEDGRLVFG